MSNYIDCLGLRDLLEDENMFEGFVHHIINNGKRIEGYTGHPYYINNYGTSEFITRFKKEEERKYDFLGMDVHTQGNCIWNTRLCAAGDITPKDADILERRIMACNAETGYGMATVNLVNADVIPSFMEGDYVEMQVVALATSIEYFKDEDEYADSIPKPEIGNKLLIGEGAVLAVGFLNNNNPELEDFRKRPEIEEYNLVRGTVKELYWGTFDMRTEGEKSEENEEDVIRPYIRCIIDTEFGPLEIEHTIEQVSEGQRNNMSVGSTVIATVILSGDVAINEYENGFVCNEENDLELFKYAFTKGASERILVRLAEDCIYTSDAGEKNLIGKKDIFDHLEYVKKENEFGYNCYSAEISGSKDDENLDYGSGRKCLILEDKKSGEYESIAFLDYDEENLITKITLSSDSRYLFKVIGRPEYTREREARENEVYAPTSFEERICSRACYHDMISVEELDFDACITAYKEDEEYLGQAEYAKAVLAEVMLNEASDVKELKNKYMDTFGKVFLKAAGFKSKDESVLSKEAFRLSRQFYRDFAFEYDENDINEEFFRNDMIAALVFVQCIGKEFTRHFMRKTEYEMCKRIGEAYSKGSFESLYPHMTDDYEHISFWVTDVIRSKEEAIDYYEGKGTAIRGKKTKADYEIVKIVKAPTEVRPNGVYIDGDRVEEDESFLNRTDEGKIASLISQNLGTETHTVLAIPSINETGELTQLLIANPDLYEFEQIK